MAPKLRVPPPPPPFTPSSSQSHPHSHPQLQSQQSQEPQQSQQSQQSQQQSQFQQSQPQSHVEPQSHNMEPQSQLESHPESQPQPSYSQPRSEPQNISNFSMPQTTVAADVQSFAACLSEEDNASDDHGEFSDEFSAENFGRVREELSPLRTRPDLEALGIVPQEAPRIDEGVKIETPETTEVAQSKPEEPRTIAADVEPKLEQRELANETSQDKHYETSEDDEEVEPVAIKSETKTAVVGNKFETKVSEFPDEFETKLEQNGSSRELSAVKLIAVSQEGRFGMAQEGAGVLSSLPEQIPCNLVFIFGNARSGKSFLMNRLLACSSVRTHPFKVINSAVPCTKGADIVSSVLPVNEIKTQSNSQALVGFVDVEGQGDAGESHDTLLSLPLLLTSKVVLFNHKGAPTVSHMLERLGVLTRAAQKVRSGLEDLEDEEEDMDEEAAASRPKIFGHLHIVFRDFSFEGDENTALAQLLTEEAVPRVVKTLGKATTYDPSEAARDRNEIRRLIRANFESVSAWIFPQPAAPDVLKENAELPPELISGAFRAVTRNLFEKIASQIEAPRLVNEQMLDGPKISELLTLLTNTVNDSSIVDVPSVFRAMEQQRLNAAETKAVEVFAEEIKKLDARLPLSIDDITKQLEGITQQTLQVFDDMTAYTSLATEAEAQRQRLQQHVSEGVAKAQHNNTTQCWQLVDSVLQTEAVKLRDEFAQWMDDGQLGKSNEELSRVYDNMKEEERDRIAEALQTVDHVFGTSEFEARLLAAEEKADAVFSIKTAQNTSHLLDLQAKAVAEEARKKEAELTAQHMELLEQINKIQEENAAKLAEMTLREAEANRLRAEREAQLSATQRLAQETQEELKKQKEEKERVVGEHEALRIHAQEQQARLASDIEAERHHKEELARNLAETERQARQAQEQQEEVRLREILTKQQKDDVERLAKERELQLKEKNDLLARILQENEAKEQKDRETRTRQIEQAFITHKEGWLLKKGQSKVRNWKKRYFRCEDGVLSYYVDEQCTVRKGQISVTTDSVIQRVDVRTVKSAAKKVKYKYAFLIISNDRSLMCRPEDDSRAAQTSDEWEIYLNYVAQGKSRDSQKP